MLKEFGPQQVDHHVMTDASGSFGCGALWNERWLQVSWSRVYCDSADLDEDGTTLKELLPVVVVCAVWGPQWQLSSVLVHCDNEGAVTVINTGIVEKIMHLLHCLFFIRAHFNIHVKAVHIPGRDNLLADAISRNNLQFLFSQVPEIAASSQRPLKAVNEETTGLDIGILAPTVRELFSAGIAKSTQKVYRSGSKSYIDFCSKFCLIPFPMSESNLAYFVALLYNDGLSPGITKSYLSVARYTQISLDFGDLNITTMLQLEGLKEEDGSGTESVKAAHYSRDTAGTKEDLGNRVQAEHSSDAVGCSVYIFFRLPAVRQNSGTFRQGI